MAIDVSTYIPVNATVQSILSNRKIFAGLALTSNTLIPTTNPLLQFSSAADVATYFGSSSNEYKSALKYFAAYNGSLNKPAYIYFGKYIVTAIAPYLRSGKVTNAATKLAALQGITAGDITVSVNGVSYPTTGIDLSGSTSLSNAASLITAAIWAANSALNSGGANFTITYDATFNVFVASIPGTGSTKTMNYFSSSTTPNLATTLQFTLATNAVLSQGANAASATTNLDNLKPLFTDQFSIYFVDTMSGGLTDVINLDTATWINGQTNKYAFFCWSNEVALESSTDTTSIWYQITQVGLANTAVFDEVLLNNSDRVSAASGCFASIDLTQPNSAITLAFKTQDGLAASVTDTDIAQILDSKGINYYGNVGVGGTKDQINFFYGSYITGEWTFIDNLVAQIWIAIQCQINQLNLFNNVGQVPNDPDGAGLIRSGITDAMNGSVTNGIIAIGVVFDNATVQSIKTNYGVDAQELTNNGYVIVNSPSSQSQRQARQSSPWYVLYVKASAVQYLPINTVTYF